MFGTDSWAEKYDSAAQAFLGDDEVVLAAVQVGRAGGLGELALSAVSGAAWLVARMKSKQRAGGLPQMFLVAVTEQRVYALSLPRSSTGLKPRATGELARWERDAIEVTSEPVTMGTKFTLVSAGEGERVEFQGPQGELSERVLRALQTPVGTTYAGSAA